MLERGEEVADPRLRSLNLDEDAACVVAYVPRQAQPRGQRVHERAEAHSLHDAIHADKRPDVPVHLHSLSPSILCSQPVDVPGGRSARAEHVPLGCAFRACSDQLARSCTAGVFRRPAGSPFRTAGWFRTAGCSADMFR